MPINCRSSWRAFVGVGGSYTGRYFTSSCLACNDPELSNGSQMKTEPSNAVPVVFLVDDDASLRGAVSNLIRSVGLRVEAFASTAEFFAAKRPDAACCLVLDVRLPGVSGLDFQVELAGPRSRYRLFSLPVTAISR